MDIYKRIRQSVVVKQQVKELKSLKKRLSEYFSETELKMLSSIDYRHILKKNIPTQQKKEMLADVLLQCSANTERLTYILNMIILLNKDFNTIDIRAYTISYKIKEFVDLKRQDRDLLLRVAYRDFYIFEDNLIQIKKVMENSIKFLEKLEFNIKSCIGVLNGRREEEK